jgi:hypothetical protein
MSGIVSSKPLPWSAAAGAVLVVVVEGAAALAGINLILLLLLLPPRPSPPPSPPQPARVSAAKLIANGAIRLRIVYFPRPVCLSEIFPDHRINFSNTELQKSSLTQAKRVQQHNLRKLL